MRRILSYQLNKVHYKNYLLLLIICLVAYWPLTFGLFSVKNDAIHYFLPYRFNISEAIRNGEWPFWSPYIYLGNPIYGDMQSGAWNPIVWLFSAVTRYNITVFHYENLLYIFIGAIGMYKLTNHFVNQSATALLIAVSYMLSGFMLSGQLINWLAAAAFLPFVIYYYLLALQSFSLWKSIKTGISLFLLFTAGYPSFFIFTIYLLAGLYVLAIIKYLNNKKIQNPSWGHFFLSHLIIGLVFAGLSLPAIVSYIDLLPYYSRGNGISYNESIINSFNPIHFISLLFPSAIKTIDVISDTDVTSRNLYLGIFIPFILIAYPPKLNRNNILLISLALFAILFGLGNATPIRKLCYDFLPLMNTFRHPAQMRLFFLISILLLTAPGIKRMLNDIASGERLTKIKSVTVIGITVILLATIMAFKMSNLSEQLAGFSITGITSSIKYLIENNSLANMIVINGLIQLFFLIAFLFIIRNTNWRSQTISFLWITNLVLIAQLILPLTFVSQTSAAEINKLIKVPESGFPITGLDKPILENSRNELDHFDKIALAGFYNKKISISKVNNSPSFLNEQEEFHKTNRLFNYVSSKPVVYLADSILQLKDTQTISPSSTCNYAFTNNIKETGNSCQQKNDVYITKFSANKLDITVQSLNNSWLVLTQSFHHHWKAWVDNNERTIVKTNISFMGLAIPAGEHHIKFRFIPANTLFAIKIMYATIILLIVAGGVSLFIYKRDKLPQ